MGLLRPPDTGTYRLVVLGLNMTNSHEAGSPPPTASTRIPVTGQ